MEFAVVYMTKEFDFALAALQSHLAAVHGLAAYVAATARTSNTDEFAHIIPAQPTWAMLGHCPWLKDYPAALACGVQVPSVRQIQCSACAWP